MANPVESNEQVEKPSQSHDANLPNVDRVDLMKSAGSEKNVNAPCQKSSQDLEFTSPYPHSEGESSRVSGSGPAAGGSKALERDKADLKGDQPEKK